MSQRVAICRKKIKDQAIEIALLREEVERLNGIIAEMAHEKPTIAPAAERISPPRQTGGILSMGIKVASGIRP